MSVMTAPSTISYPTTTDGLLVNAANVLSATPGLDTRTAMYRVMQGTDPTLVDAAWKRLGEYVGSFYEFDFGYFEVGLTVAEVVAEIRTAI